MKPSRKQPSVVLSAQCLTVEYRDLGQTIRAVTDFSIAVPQSETVALIGESGSGKTTAALAMLGMLPTSATVVSGDVTVSTDGRRVDLLAMSPNELRAFRWQHIAYVPQGSISALNPVQRISRHFEQTAQAHGLTRADAKIRAWELLVDVHLDPDRIWGSYPHELSGGTRQRIAIALAMLLKPSIIVLDEPTTALDVLTQEAVLKTLLQLQEQTGVSYLLITHDLAVAGAVADQIVTMYQGRAVEYGAAEQVMVHPVHPYTRRLLESMPTLETPAGLMRKPARGGAA